MIRRLVLATLLLLPTLAWGATRYVKTPCTFNGDGTANACAASGGAAGAYNSIANMASAASCGDTVNVDDGTYNENNITFAQSCAVANELIVQWNGWTAVGSLATSAAYWQNTRSLSATPGVDWTRCSTCNGADNAACNGVPATCTDAWYHTPSAGKKALWAVTPTGGITPRRASLCSPATCTGAGTPCSCCTGAGAGATCDGLTAQYDAFSVDGADTKLTVKWGSSLPTNPDANGENNQFIAQITGNGIYIRGIHFRYNINSAINTTSTSDRFHLQDFDMKYFNDSGNGSSRALHVDSSSNILIEDGELAYCSSEPLHVTGLTGGHVSGTIRRIYDHDIGSFAVLGPGTRGTPNCTTFTNDAPIGGANTTGDFSGLVVENNVFSQCNEPWQHGNCNSGGDCGAVGILFESDCDGLTVRHNLITGVEQAFKWAPSNGGPANHTNNNLVYDNVVFNLNDGQHAGASIVFNMDDGGNADPIQGNKIFSNTATGFNDSLLKSNSGTAVSGNFLVDNIGQRKTLSSPSVFLADVHQALATWGTVSNNVAWGGQTSGKIGQFNTSGTPADYLCSTDPNTKCADPLFVSASDLHIQSGSPAKDAGTATGMPAGRTTDICNSIASLHGFPNYNDCQAASGTVDIGADEYVAAGAGRRLMVISKWKMTAPRVATRPMVSP